MLYKYEKDNVFESNRPGLCQSHCKDIHQKITREQRITQRIPKELAKECYFPRGCAPFYGTFPPPGSNDTSFFAFF